jgi:hypothetical protein
MDIAVKNKQGAIIGYVVNIPEESLHLGQHYGKNHFKGASGTEVIESLNISSNFKMCAMDRQTANNLVLMNPKI